MKCLRDWGYQGRRIYFYNVMENQILLLSGLSHIVCELTDEQAGKLFKCILAKAEDVNLDIEDQTVKIAFNAIELLMEEL